MSKEIQQLQQRVWVKEQEINALKVQNRHLISKLEEAEVSGKPNQINTQQVAAEIQQQLKPLLIEIQKQSHNAQLQVERTLTQAFEMVQATLRGIYQQSQRSQQAVDTLTEHSKDLESRTNDSRKADQTFYQEKIISIISSFCDRLERQLDQRLSALAVVDLMVTKQNEGLIDLESIKAISLGIQKNAEASRSEISRVENKIAEASQKLIEIEMQGKNGEEIARDLFQQIQNHRTEFKHSRGEIRAVVDQAQAINENVARIGDALGARMTSAVINPSNYNLRTAATNEASSVSIAAKPATIDSAPRVQQEVVAAPIQDDSEAPQEDLVMILELLRAQKSELSGAAKEAESFLKKYQKDSKAEKNNTNQNSNTETHNSTNLLQDEASP